MSRIPKQLQGALAAMLVSAGIGGAALIGEGNRVDTLTPYLQAAAEDGSTTDAVKLALVLGSFFESSFRHVGKPYVDKLGKGQPLTVCNGLTGTWIDPRKSYSPAECYSLEVGYYRKAEQEAKRLVTKWHHLTVMQRAVVLDFIHNLGVGAFASSTMLKLLNQGQIEAACKQNERWVRGTVRGVSVVLPGLVVRANARADLCGGADVLPDF